MVPVSLRSAHSWGTTVRRVGENALPIGPAPAKMVAPDAAMLVFHRSEKT